MLDYALPALFAVFLWWFSTGLVIYLDRLPRHTFRWSLLGATLAVAVALMGLARGAADTAPAGAYTGFACALVLWAWLELSFYTGLVTGPRRRRCAPGCSGWAHFGHALQTSLYHELASLGLAVLVVAVSWGEPNPVGLWTFLLLWAMHQSARLNVFLGVRNLDEEFLPEHLDFIGSFVTRRSMNLLFPVSVTLATAAVVLLGRQAWLAEPGSTEAVGAILLTALAVLGLLEHWLLMLPLSMARFWRWAPRLAGDDTGRAAPAAAASPPRLL